jgi:hypothetical protein
MVVSLTAPSDTVADLFLLTKGLQFLHFINTAVGDEASPADWLRRSPCEKMFKMARAVLNGRVDRCFATVDGRRDPHPNLDPG